MSFSGTDLLMASALSFIFPIRCLSVIYLLEYISGDCNVKFVMAGNPVIFEIAADHFRAVSVDFVQACKYCALILAGNQHSPEMGAKRPVALL